MSLFPPALMLPPALTSSRPNEGQQPNFIILVFDAWSGTNNSLYGYPRQTTPNLERLAEKAIVYHTHYAGSYFTTPGTTSLLTGVLPWRHELYHPTFTLKEDYRTKNLFGLFPEYFRLAYTHNTLAEEVLQYMESGLETLIPHEDLLYATDPVAKIFRKDYDAASVGWIRAMETVEDGFANSIFLSRLFTFLIMKREESLMETYPLGLPKHGTTNSFLLEEAIDWLADNIGKLSSPNLTYFHLLPPHNPYNTRKDFYGKFASDNYRPPEKPEHFMTDGYSYQEHLEERRGYDEYILFVDSEIQRLFDLLAAKGDLENTWIILTSDHGELFERGIHAHGKPSWHEPLTKVPLLIFPPGQQNRVNIHTPTQAIDIIPTLLSITGKAVPEWLEGQVLPPYNLSEQEDRAIFLVDGRYSELNQPYTNASLMLRQANHKLIYHFGTEEDYANLPDHESLEFYNLIEDPNELSNLANVQPALVKLLMETIQAKMRSEGVL